MKIFISWSGKRSQKVAELLNEWIPCVIQVVEPWISSKDIDRGAQWFTEITGQLALTTIGIVCLTKQNRNKPWILFESGAIAKGITSSKVCTILVDLRTTDLENPLAQFNHTIPDKIGLRLLVNTINNSLDEVKRLKEPVLANAFDTYWPQFDEEFRKIMEETDETDVISERSDSEIMLEILSTVRNLDKRLRSLEFKRTIDNPGDKDGNNIMDPENIVVLRRCREFLKKLIDIQLTREEVIEMIGQRFNVDPAWIIVEYDREITKRFGK